LTVLGAAGLLTALGLDTHDAASAASQVWSPFVLVAGLLLVGLVAEEDGLFRVVGHRLARLAPNALALFAGAAVLVAAVTALLNLDTSVVFLTPVLIYAARGRGVDEGPLLYGTLLLSNAGSLLLPGSNLTNLIVAGHLHVSGARFAARMAPAWAAAVVITAVVVALAHRRWRVVAPGAAAPGGDGPEAPTARYGLGLLAVTAVTVFVVVVRAPALPVVSVGVVAVGLRLVTGRMARERAVGVLGLPVLLGLFGVAVTLGTLGRCWSGPATMLSHLDGWATAAVAAGASVLVNNLPAASLLGSRVPARPYALLVGLDIGPNLFVSGSLAWFLWLRSARAAGASPSIARASLLGVLSAPVAMAAAVGLLSVTGSH
jgi:arsenical pump membrane protein